MKHGTDLEYTLININQLEPFSGVLYDTKGNKTTVTGNPFYVPEDYLNKNDKDSEAMQSLQASVEQEGILTPLLVRPSKENENNENNENKGSSERKGNKNKYELLSGYRRKKVCEVLAVTRPEFQEVPVIVLECDDDEASSIITSSNVQRRAVSLLDTIVSCGRMYRAMMHRGSGKDRDKEWTAIMVSKIMGLTKRSVVRYSSLIDLPEFMLQLIGHKVKTEDGEPRLSIRAGEVMHGIGNKKLEMINQIMQKDNGSVVTENTAKKLKTACKENPEITIEEIEQIITGAIPAKTEKAATKKRRFALSDDMINAYCANMSNQQIEELLGNLLKHWADSGGAATTSE